MAHLQNEQYQESAEFYYPDDTEDSEEIVNLLKESLFVLELKPFLQNRVVRFLSKVIGY